MCKVQKFDEFINLQLILFIEVFDIQGKEISLSQKKN